MNTKKTIVVAFLLTFIVQSFGQTGDRLHRLVTKSMPADLEPYYPQRYFSLGDEDVAHAVIVRSDDASKESWATSIRVAIHERWGIELPVIDEHEVRTKHPGKALILFGTANDNMLLRQLNANALLGNNKKGYELRSIFNVLDWKRDVLYFGGRSEQEVNQAVEALFGHIKTPQRVPFLIDCAGWDERLSAKQLDELVEVVQDHYDHPATYVVTQNSVLRDAMRPIVERYRMTGDPAYVKTFARMQRIMVANYGKDTGGGRNDKVPSFTFHLYPQYVYLMEHDDAFTAEDRWQAAEFIRKITEEMMDYYEMEKPMELYDASRQEYLTNHPCFASRSVSSASRYLLTRYDYEPAKYWAAVADNAFAGVAPHPFSPEDAAGYQYLVYNIFMDYALASGTYGLDYFESETFTNYLSYVKLQLNHLGYTAGFGDANVIGSGGGTGVLRYAVELFGDQEAAFLLDLCARSKQVGNVPGLDAVDYTRAPGKKSLGLHYQEVVPFKQKRYGVGDYYRRPTLDKATFRGGWEWRKGADFLSVTGINGDGLNHGHYDANSISQYISGNKLWLWEGDYIRKSPYDHNAIEVNRNGKIADLSRVAPRRRKLSLAQILAAGNTPNRDFSLLSTLLEDYNGANWIRNINYAAGEGFWVIDELDIQAEGNYIVQAYWRTTGKVSRNANTYIVTQQKAEKQDSSTTFFITEGTGAVSYRKAVFENSHSGRVRGNLERYQYSDRNTQYVIQRKEGGYRKGDKVYFVNFMQAISGQRPNAPKVKEVADGAFIVKSGHRIALAVIGSFSNDFFDIDADICFIGPEGIVARGLRRLQLGAFRRQTDKPENIFLPMPTSVRQGSLSEALTRLFHQKGEVLPNSFRSIDVPEKNTSVNTAVFTSEVVAIASTDSHYAIGRKNKEVTIYDNSGREVATSVFKGSISTISAIETSLGTRWAIGTEPIDPKAQAGHLFLLDQRGNVLWRREIPEYHERKGIVKTLFTATVKDAIDPLIIAGAESWSYFAFDLSGNLVWKQSVTHGATVGAAGDMDGDGTDEIAAGEEYYYHSIIKDGKKLPRVLTPPFDYAVAVLDLNNDGLEEAVFGRGDGHLYVQTVTGNPIKTWRLNIGGKPTALVELAQGVAKLAVSNSLGGITFVSGDGVAVKHVAMPAAIEDMVIWKNQLYAVCLDGFVYRLTTHGDIVEKYAYAYDSAAIHAPKIVASGDGIRFFSGNKLFFVHN